MITVSAPAKIHLLGEHAVVYGKPALLAATDLRITVSIENFRSAQNFDSEFIQLKKVIETSIKKKFKVKEIPSYSITISSDIPIGSGLGSSAAISAAYSCALLKFLNLPHDNKTVFEIAYEGEKFFHGNPSGGDLATVIEGSFLWYRREFDFLKTFSPLPFGLHKNIKNFYLIDSGKPEETTKEMVVDVVGVQYKKNPKLVQRIFDDQERLTKQMVIALRDGDEESLLETIRDGEKNLEKLGVVGKKAQKIIREIEKLGGAAKIMGGGGVKDGSGMLLVYLIDNKKIAELKAFKLIDVKLNQKGIVIHE